MHGKRKMHRTQTLITNLIKIGKKFYQVDYKKVNRFWCAVLTTLFLKLKNSLAITASLIYCFFILSNNQVVAKENFELSLGDKLNVFSDKLYRKSADDSYDLIGNVIITHYNESLYGEKASLGMGSGKVNVSGNVRYVAPTMTLYGSELFYNLKTNYLEVKNARIISETFVILGKTLTRLSDSVLTGVDAEFTTCKDCPESWSIFGKKVHITLGQYIRINDAFIKVNGVVVMYIPYIVLPIKKERQTGLLFPKFSLNFDGIGAVYQQPWFWSINQSKDMTLIPSIYGKRGLGGELQYRQVLGEKKWFEINSLAIGDRIYDRDNPGKNEDDDNAVSGHHYLRHFTDYEHHFTVGDKFNHHLYYSGLRDLDTIRDFDEFSHTRVKGSEIGGASHFELRQDLFSLGIESYYNKNLLVDNSREFDNSYVQILPKVSMSTIPYPVIRSSMPFVRNITIGGDADYTVFKQNHVEESLFIRNANRINIKPYVDWHLGEFGPVQVRTNAAYDYQKYAFPEEKAQGRENSFSKRAVVHESEISVEISKIFGLAYEEEVDKVDKVDKRKKDTQKYIKKKNTDYSLLIGDLPRTNSGFSKNKTKVKRNSYRHSQVFKLKHNYLTQGNSKGSERFFRQITDPTLRDDGIFDNNDTIKELENLLANTDSRQEISKSNSIEFQWNNSVIRKYPESFDPLEDNKYLRENFNYSKVSYFNISQGLDLKSEETDLNKRLTRLYITGGISLDKTSFSGSEYYFHDTAEHIFDFNVNQKFEQLTVNLQFRYNSVNVGKSIVWDFIYTPFDIISFKSMQEYDLESKNSIRRIHGVQYTPLNKCWRFNLLYERTFIKSSKWAFNFEFSFDGAGFKSWTDS
jgi:LPS-assembly protein